MALPFYEPPRRKTSADIINEARAAIRDSHVVDSSFSSTSIKPLQTQRPFTPKEKERLLFGRKASNRPPSSFSLRYLQTQPDLCSPPSTANSKTDTSNIFSNLNYGSKSACPTKKVSKTKRSNSIPNIGEDKIFDLGVQNIPLNKIKLPSLESVQTLPKKTSFKSTYSLDNLPEEIEGAAEDDYKRNAFSSPQERTDYSDSLDLNSPFGRPSQKQNSLSQCLLLGPHNLSKLFENKHIVENSETLFVKTGYFNKGSKPTETLNLAKEKNIDKVLELLNEESKRKHNDAIVTNLLNDLYDCMEKGNCLNSNLDSKMKIRTLKCLYKFVESHNEKLLLNIARIILALKVTGNNLSGVCKLIFKVAKCDSNDYLFSEKNILDLFVDALGRCSPLDDGEACVYGYGSVKFLTMNPKLLKRIMNLGILPLMVLHIKIINNAKQEKIQIPEQTEHALFQLTGALRNLVSDEIIYEEFDASETIYQLCQTLDLFSSNLDLVSNISRILSAVSSNDDFCHKIVDYKNIYKVFVVLFDKYPGNEEIIVRLAYTLGNVLAKLDNSRIKFYQEKNSIKSIISLWKIYLERNLKSCSLKIDNNNENDSNCEDVMIKIIRIVANLSINTDIGKAMNEKYGNQLIDEFLKVLISNPFKKNEELALSVLSTLNNLSYYYSTDFDKDIFHIKQIDIMEAISEYVSSKNGDCVTEAIRILGNLSRSKITRNYVVEKDLFAKLIGVLNNDDVILLKTTVGVFVNLMADNRNRLLFKNGGGLKKLINILNLHGQYDWPLSMLICQVIWNICIDSIDLYELISDSEMQQLLSILADYLDEERLFGITDSSEDLEIYGTPEFIVWEEFANVATNLLEKIEHFLDTLEQLESTATDTNELDIPKTKDSGTNLSFAAW